MEEKEFYLPSIVDNLIEKEKKQVSVLFTTSTFHGMTYQMDLQELKEYIRKQIDLGIYPNHLWEEQNEQQK